MAKRLAADIPAGSYVNIGIGMPVLVANAVYWLGKGDLAGLAFSTIATLGCFAYTLIAMRSNHHLHRTSARDREAALAAVGPCTAIELTYCALVLGGTHPAPAPPLRYHWQTPPA